MPSKTRKERREKLDEVVALTNGQRILGTNKRQVVTRLGDKITVRVEEVQPEPSE